MEGSGDGRAKRTAAGAEKKFKSSFIGPKVGLDSVRAFSQARFLGGQVSLPRKVSAVRGLPKRH